jgi:hypothetical protein
VVVLLTSLSGLAHAAGKVAVVEFTGAKKKTIRERVVEALKKADVEIVESDGAPGEDADAYVELARKDEVAAIVSGDTQMSKKGWKLKLVVRNGADGSVIEEVMIQGPWLPGLLKKIDKEAAKNLAGPIDEGAVPEVEEPEPEPEAEPEDRKDQEEEEDEAEKEPEEEEEPDDDPASKGPRPSPLQLGAGMRAFTRDFSYNQDVNRNLRAYELGGAPAAFVTAAWYPAAHFTAGVPANIGIVGDFEQSIAASSELSAGGTSYSTSMRSFSGGLRFRIPFSKHEVGLSAKYGQHRFEVDGDQDPAAAVATGTPIERDFVPDVAYEYVRPGLDARFQVGKFALGGYLGYRIVMSVGDLESDQWFPEASATAADAGLFLGYGVSKGLYALAGFDLRRYGFDMHSKPNDLTDDRDVAGGATDQYLAGWLGVEWRLGDD